jgi:predicted membrane-bound dolichyl-phosphate-mannose-protein mannosyltransferase
MGEVAVTEVATGETVTERGQDRSGSSRARPLTVGLLVLLVLFSLGVRLVWLDKPHGALIFDENYYVNAARVILGLPLPPNAPYADAPLGRDPNTEHPPGAKLLIAGSMRLFGDNARGWRLPSVLFGTLSIPLLYGVVRRAGGAERVALLAAALYAFDNLVFVHGRIATLDIFLVAGLLLGLYCFLAGRPVLAGLAFAAATLCKIGGLYGVGVVVAFAAVRLGRERLASGRWDWRPLRPLAVLLVVYALAFPAALAALDSVWSEYKNPAAHVAHIFRYGFALTRPDGPQGQESDPWQWLLNEVPMNYLRTEVQFLEGNEVKATRATIWFRGAMNPYVIAIAPLAIAYAASLASRRRDDCATLALIFFVVTYAPFWPAALIAHRISYIFYFLPTLPAVAIGAAQLLYAPRLPRVVRWAYLGAVLLGFYGYFPFRTIP